MANVDQVFLCEYSNGPIHTIKTFLTFLFKIYWIFLSFLYKIQTETHKTNIGHQVSYYYPILFFLFHLKL